MANKLQFSNEELILLSKYTNSSDITDILNKFGGDINKLKSYVKWLYKYGGTGSKGNGGSGDGSGSSKWSCRCTIDNKTINSDTLVLTDNETNKYDINITINRPGTSTYKVYIYIDNKLINTTSSIKLSADNKQYNGQITILKNCNIQIKTENLNEEDDEQIIETFCIRYPYKIQTSYIDNNNEQYKSSTLFYSQLINGIKLKIDHDIYINASNVKLKLNIVGNAKIPQIDIQLSDTAINNDTNNSYTLIDLYDILHLSEENDDIYGTYTITGIFSYNYNGNNEIPIFTNISILPNADYLKVVPKLKNAIIYKNSQIENGELNEDTYIYDSKYISLEITAYKINQSTRANIVLSENGNTLREETITTGEPFTLNHIQLSNNTENITEHILQFNMEGNIWNYYIYVNKADDTLSWLDKNVLNIYEQSYFRESELHLDNKISESTLLNINKNFFGQGHIQMNMIDTNVLLYNDNRVQIPDTLSKTDLLISLGIQFSEVNDKSQLIGTFTFDIGDPITFELHQNSLNIGDNKYEIFIPKELDYNVSDKSKYHLLNILIRNVETNIESRKYELIIYIDGYIENAIDTYFSTSKKLVLKNITFNEGNYALNLLDVTYVGFADPDEEKRQISDIDIVQYFYKYDNSFTTDEINYFVELKDNIFDKLEYIDINNQGFITSVERFKNIQNISSLKSTLFSNTNHNIPVLILNMNNEQTPYDFLSNYFCKSYKDESLNSSGSVNVSSFSYIDKNGNTYDYNNAALFKLQGSSSGQFKSKNFTLTMISTTDGYKVLCTPNFDSSDNEDANMSFLPENTLLFKADAVDSTHANNTSAGLFINKNTAPFKDARDIHEGAESYKRYIKNCLVGFPILVIFGLQKSTDVYEYYYMGIYNCNLGRDSLLNLGYYNLSSILGDGVNPGNLVELDGETHVNLLDHNHDGFGVYMIADEYYQGMDNLCVAEIQGGNPYYDFSQYDSTILFEDRENNEGMFGDFYPKLINNQYQKNKIQTFVRNVSLFGGSLFESLQKNMSDNSDDQYGYENGYRSHYSEGNLHYITRSTNYVPNYKYQFTRYIDQFTKDDTRTNEFNTFITRIKSNTQIWQNLFYHFIGVFNEDELENINDYLYTNQDSLSSDKISYLLNYQSLIEYYTICMALGLTDSVQKNLNIKSFKQNGPFYIAFYDMDTSFSRDNGGAYVEPFAFSDYWGLVNDENVIYRDFYPDKETAAKADQLNINIAEDWSSIPLGFDIPSSYLFAIAKYAKLFYDKNNDDTNYQSNPNYFWYTLRKSENSPLSNAKSFIDNYFGVELNNINRLFFNANYRFKYLQKTSTGFDSTNIKAFHGRGLYSLEDWLNNRFHILDAYFNITQAKSLNNNYQYYDVSANKWKDLQHNNSNIYDPSFADVTGNTDDSYDRSNKDIYLERTIFQEGTTDDTKYTGNSVGTISIRALDYSGMYINYQKSSDQFICINSNKLYSFKEPPGGGQLTFKFGGSISWIYVLSFNTLIPTNKILTLNAPYLENINVTNGSGSLETLKLVNIKSVKNINIQSNNAICQLNIVNNSDSDDNYPNLRTINISNSKCGLKIDRVNVKSIIAKNISSLSNDSESNENNLKSIIIDNCNNLTSCNFDNSILNTLHVTSIWNNNIEINNTKTKKIEFTNSKYFSNSKIKISNDETVEEIILTGFETVIIENCNKLKKLTINEYSINTTSTIHLKSLQINNSFRGEDALFNDKLLSNLDLTQFNHLEEVSFYNIRNLNSVTFASGTSENNKQIKLLAHAFEDTNLRELSGSYITFILCDEGNSTSNYDADCAIFRNTPYTLTLNGINMKFGVQNKNTSLRNIFTINDISIDINAHNIEPALNYTNCVQFINNLQNKEYVTSFNNAFYRQSKISNEILTNGKIVDSSLIEGPEYKLKFEGYNNLSDIQNMFYKTKLHILNNDLFKNAFGNVNELKLLNFCGSQITDIHKDTFKPIIHKIKSLLCDIKPNLESSREIINARIYEIDEENKYAPHNKVYIKDLFTDENGEFGRQLETIIGINILNTNIDFTLFEDGKQYNIKTIHSFCSKIADFKINNNDDNITHINISNINLLGLKNIDKLEVLYKSFILENNNAENERVNILNYINWENYKKLKKNISDTSNYPDQNMFNFYKQSQYDDVETILGMINNSPVNDSNDIDISYLFNKCIFNENNNTALTCGTLCSKFTNISYLFAYSTAINNNEEIGIKVSNETLKYFTNATNCSGIFEGVCFNGIDSYPIPADLFSSNSEITILSRAFANTKIIGNNKTYKSGVQKDVFYQNQLSDINLINNDYNIHQSLQNVKLSDELYESNNSIPIKRGYPFIPNSLFNNINSSITISEIFANSDFEGYIPDDIFKNSNGEYKTIKNAYYWIRNCKILPQKYTTLRGSQLDNFKTENNENELNIYLLFPNSLFDANYLNANNNGLCSCNLCTINESQNRIYVLTNKTINDINDNSSIRLYDMLPLLSNDSYLVTNFYDDTNHVTNYGIIPLTKELGITYINTFFNIKDDDTYSEGISKDIFNAHIITNSFIDSNFSSLMYGYLFEKNTLIGDLDVNKEDMFNNDYKNINKGIIQVNEYLTNDIGGIMTAIYKIASPNIIYPSIMFNNSIPDMSNNYIPRIISNGKSYTSENKKYIKQLINVLSTSILSIKQTQIDYINDDEYDKATINFNYLVFLNQWKANAIQGQTNQINQVNITVASQIDIPYDDRPTNILIEYKDTTNNNKYSINNVYTFTYDSNNDLWS